MTRPRRRIAVAVAAGLALTLAGCGTQQASSGSDSSGDSSGSGAFPVSIKSALGTAHIDHEPKRVVTLGQGATESAIALGTVPVGTDSYEWGANKDGYLPWVEQAVKKRGGKLPKLLKGGENLDVESVAALHPDLILAPWSGITKKQYDVLSDIAPTVAYPGKAWSTPWKKEIQLVGKALGKPKAAGKAIDTINQRFASVAKQHPEFAKHSFVYTYTQGPGTLGVYRPHEQRVQALTKMGLKLDPVVATLKGQNGSDWALIGLENADKLKNADLMFTFYMDAATKKQVRSQKLYQQIPAVAHNCVVAAKDRSFVTASSMINPLTVPWMLKRYVPMIDKAIDRCAG